LRAWLVDLAWANTDLDLTKVFVREMVVRASMTLNQRHLQLLPIDQI